MLSAPSCASVSPSSASTSPLWTLGEDVSKLRVVLVFIDVVNSHMSAKDQPILKESVSIRLLTFANYQAEDTCVLDLGRRDRHSLETGEQDHVGSFRFFA